MRFQVEQTECGHILYDADRAKKPDCDWFDARRLADQGRLLGTASGRGTTWVFRAGGGELVLRHYHRGGAMAGLLGDLYPWLPLAWTRPWRELQLLARLHAAGLPVPRPAAARVWRHGAFYRGDLVTECIAGAISLTQQLRRSPLGPGGWRAIGETLRRFHAWGADHADLNAHNILLVEERVYLIDFDRGRQRRPGAWCDANLRRLRRSLDKLTRLEPRFHFDGEDFASLLEAYGWRSRP